MNKIHRYGFVWTIIYLLCGLITPVSFSNAENGQANDTVQHGSQEFAYRPPTHRGSPRGRAGGGTRSIVGPLSALAPKHTGLTSQSQPRLYWYLKSGFRNKQRFRIGKVGEENLLDIILPAQINGGIQCLDLAHYHLSLAKNSLYVWRVELEPEPYETKEPIGYSSGAIEVIAASPDLEQAGASQRPYLAAQQGLWYDALDGVSLLIEHGADAAYWHQQRAVLLKQGGLDDAASYDLRVTKAKQ